MTRAAVIVEATEWERLQAQLRDMGERLSRVERQAQAPTNGRLTPRAVGKLYHIRHDVIRDACKRGELPAELTPKGWLIAPASAETWWTSYTTRTGGRNQ